MTKEAKHEEHEAPCESCGGCIACQCECVCSVCGATGLVMGDQGACSGCELAGDHSPEVS
jgi:hypothetical protein